MTLVIANATQKVQLVVADRLVTDSRSKKTIDDETYKVLLYVNERQCYQFGIGFAGLAEIRGKKTSDWLCTILPEVMTGAIDIGLAIPRFADVCTRELRSLREPIPLIFVMAGRFNDVPDHPQQGRWVPFLSIVSNAIGEYGRQLGTPTRAFQAYSSRLLHKNQKITVCRGDLTIKHHSINDLRALYRRLHRDLSANAKVELCARYIRNVAARSERVGDHILGVAIQDGCCTGYNLPPEGRRPRRTMPHFLSASGWSATNITIIEHHSQ